MDYARETLNKPINSHDRRASSSDEQESGVAEQWLSNWQDTLEEKIEKTANKLVQSVESASQEVGKIMDTQLSRRPWTYLSACIGGGIIVGYFLSRARHSKKN
ncbi:MAG: hypothetical protein J0L93_02945 [Deltaproteobacteria bacterium]|nr:hypothetical protein [Deltaproteobacteria bacterium]